MFYYTGGLRTRFAGTRPHAGVMMRHLDPELEAWLLHAAPRAVAYARALVKRPEDAEDVVHDVVCRLLDHNEYNLAKDGERLLFRSVTNACINRTTRRREIASLSATQADGAALQDSLASGSASDPAQIAIGRELSQAIERELKNLPPLQRAAVELKALEKSLKEIADILGLTVPNVGVLIFRGRKLLAKRLGPQVEEFKL